jgi:sRNA-binding carbon storage regulator CsrA
MLVLKRKYGGWVNIYGKDGEPIGRVRAVQARCATDVFLQFAAPPEIKIVRDEIDPRSLELALKVGTPAANGAVNLGKAVRKTA